MKEVFAANSLGSSKILLSVGMDWVFKAQGRWCVRALEHQKTNIMVVFHADSTWLLEHETGFDYVELRRPGVT